MEEPTPETHSSMLCWKVPVCPARATVEETLTVVVGVLGAVQNRAASARAQVAKLKAECTPETQNLKSFIEDTGSIWRVNASAVGHTDVTVPPL